MHERGLVEGVSRAPFVVGGWSKRALPRRAAPPVARRCWGRAVSTERRAPAPLAEPKPEKVALRYWTQHVGGGIDNRIQSALPGWVRDFGLRRLQEAMDVVLTERPKAGRDAKYHHLVKTLRKFRAPK
jgi:hypothetical protein